MLKWKKSFGGDGIYRKYFRSAVRFFLVYLLLPVFFLLTRTLIDVIYAAIFEISPNLIPRYNQITQKEQYEALSRAVNAVSALITVFVVGFVTAVHDNARYEDLIRKTNGLFKIPSEIPHYFKRNFPADVIAAAIAPAVFVLLTLPEYTKLFLDNFGFFLAPHLCLAEAFRPITSYLLIFASVLLGRTLAIPRALSRFRSSWLASFVDS